ncbi:MAG: exosortase-associated protein EpsI, B-type [Pseudomonadota bacterium]
MSSKPQILFALGMIVAVTLAHALKPTQKIADRQEKINLETMVPAQFDGWEVDKTLAPIQVNTEAQDVLKRIYAQTLSRAYVNKQGQRVMLSIAYGNDQSDGMRVHRPEVCYEAQGFQILKQEAGQLTLGASVLPVRYVLAVQGMRIEPITYWMTIGDSVTKPGFQQKIKQLQYGLTGKIPDGMLVRISTIDPDEKGAYKLQAQFAKQMLAAMPPSSKVKLVGDTPL